VPVVSVKSSKRVTGGAANVALNAAGMGAPVVLIGVAGKTCMPMRSTRRFDPHRNRYRTLLSAIRTGAPPSKKVRRRHTAFASGGSGRRVCRLRHDANQADRRAGRRNMSLRHGRAVCLWQGRPYRCCPAAGISKRQPTWQTDVGRSQTPRIQGLQRRDRHQTQSRGIAKCHQHGVRKPAGDRRRRRMSLRERGCRGAVDAIRTRDELLRDGAAADTS
jgi:hypothetical protein